MLNLGIISASDQEKKSKENKTISCGKQVKLLSPRATKWMCEAVVMIYCICNIFFIKKKIMLISK